MREYELSNVHIINGPRGSGKTLLLTHYAILYLIQCAFVIIARIITGDDTLFPRMKTHVWSNYPVRCKVRINDGKKIFYLKTKELDIKKLAVWDKEYRDGYILYDEIDQDLDRQDWMAQYARYIVKGVKLMRHRNLSLAATLQFIDELNGRLYKQADIITDCRDIAFTPWGRRNRLHPGEVSALVYRDKSGIMTGYGYNENGRIYKRKFYGKRYWGNYSTIFDHPTVKEKIKIQIDEVLVGNEAKQAEIEENNDALYQAIDILKYHKPGQMIKGEELRSTAEACGCNYDARKLGAVLTELGVERKLYQGKTRYSLESIVLPEKQELEQ